MKLPKCTPVSFMFIPVCEYLYLKEILNEMGSLIIFSRIILEMEQDSESDGRSELMDSDNGIQVSQRVQVGVLVHKSSIALYHFLFSQLY